MAEHQTAHEIAHEIREREGWTDATLLDLLLDYSEELTQVSIPQISLVEYLEQRTEPEPYRARDWVAPSAQAAQPHMPRLRKTLTTPTVFDREAADVWVVEVEILDHDGEPSHENMFYGPFATEDAAESWVGTPEAFALVESALVDGGHSDHSIGDFEFALVRQPHRPALHDFLDAIREHDGEPENDL